MTFKVKYRTLSGSIAEERISADKRSDVFKKLKDRGITATSISLCDGSTAAKIKAGRKTSIKILAVASLLIVVAICVCRLRENKINDGDSTPSSAQNKLKAQKDRKTKKPRTFKTPVPQYLTTNAAPPEISRADVIFEPRKSLIVTIPRPKGVIFTNAFENFLGEIMTATPGERFLEVDLGEWFDEAFLESLKTRIEIQPSDSDSVAATKQAVIDAKKAIAEYVNEGRTPSQVVLEAREELNKIADYRDKLQNDFHVMLTMEDDPEILKMYVDEANKMLKDYATPPLEAPENIDDLKQMIEDFKSLNPETENKQS